MPPPGHGPSLAIMIATPKDKNGGDNGRMDPPGSPSSGPDEQGKLTPGPHDIVHADQHCIDCKWYNVDDGTCQKWSGQYDPQDACWKYFDAADESDEPDADDQGGGGPNDNDADDQSQIGGGPQQ